jgi:hypothetical protein
MATPDPTKPRKRGPPFRDGPGHIIGVRVQREMLAKIDAFAATQGGGISRPAAIRKMIETTIAERKN